ncbi:MAG: TIGR03619 family F420-dependent LLM class oxidoreductase, partial [Actinobacteria bacterium]|nr:TIGR03619 family F420-dependent LLM class oxidoreductase [Actinomycetota bacterium]
AGSWATPDNQITVARRAEELGYSSLWVAQRLLYPVEPRDEYPSALGQPWPAAFESVVDPIVTLAHVAGATNRIRLGTATLIAAFHSPLLLAKELATLDIVCDGRLDVGLSLGWSSDEYESCGVPFKERGARLDDFIRCLQALWADDPVEYSGRFYSVPRSLFLPKPRQRPRPPILIGGYASATLRRAATLGDGYIGGNVPLARVAPLVEELRAAESAAGREPGSLRVVCRGSVRLFDDALPDDAERRPLWGSLEQIRTDVARYRELGLDELFFELNFDPTIGSRTADPKASMATALHLLEALAPAQ